MSYACLNRGLTFFMIHQNFQTSPFIAHFPSCEEGKDFFEVPISLKIQKGFERHP